MVIKRKIMEIGGKKVEVEIFPHSKMKLGDADDLLQSLDEIESMEKNDVLFKKVAKEYSELYMREINDDKLKMHYELGRILRKLDDMDLTVEKKSEAYSSPAKEVFSYVIDLVAKQINSEKIKFNRNTVLRYASIEWKLANINKNIVYSEGMSWGHWCMILHYNNIYRLHLGGDNILEDIVLFLRNLKNKSCDGGAPFRKYLKNIHKQLKLKEID